MLFFIVAIVIYGIAFLGMKLGPQNADYLYKFKFVCVICAILACELLASILVDLLRVLIINLCGIIVELIRRKYKQICEHLCHATNVYHCIDMEQYCYKIGPKHSQKKSVLRAVPSQASGKGHCGVAVN
uniref:Uncharacterized protein n=1 Tax=Quercus lobata TaxID=97700 RepID=A0A7N2R2C5_QUELO